MPQIGSVTVTVWKGILTQSTFGFQLFEQGGVDGFGVQFGGRKVQPSQITTVTRIGSTITDFNVAEASYRSLLRSTLFVSDQFARPWNGVVVLGVSVAPSFDALGYIATANWQFLVQSLP